MYWRRRIGIIGVTALGLWALMRSLTFFGGGEEALDAAVPPPTSAPTTVQEVCPPGGFQPPPPEADPPPELVATLQEAVDNRSLDIRDTSISVWIEGYGEVVADDPDRALVPASNQKLFTAMGLLILLPHDLRLETDLVATGPIGDDGTLDGNLVVVGGGDPLIKREGPHSVQTIAQLVQQAGITRITGDVLGDETRYDDVRKAPGWLEWQMPLPGGSMSALMVNSNSRIGAQDYLADPTVHNAGLVEEALEEVGIPVDGGAGEGEAPDDGEVVGTLESPTVEEMVRFLLLESDNMAAEMLTKEVGLRERDDPSTAVGLAAIEEAIEAELCIDLQGTNDDASGISRNNLRSAREWRLMLQAAQDEAWWPILHEGLPQAGVEEGTLTYRFVDTPAAESIRAKTGSVGVGVALSGYVTTAGGRQVVFSAVANGSDPDPAVAAIDQLIIRVASDGS